MTGKFAPDQLKPGTLKLENLAQENFFRMTMEDRTGKWAGLFGNINKEGVLTINAIK